jgi:integral membrane protein
VYGHEACYRPGMLASPLARFRTISLLEGASYVALLGIAMPLKYLADQARAVTVVGAIHGGLFVLFGLALIAATRAERWSLRTMSIATLAALLPLGAFWLERRLRTGRFPATR